MRNIATFFACLIYAFLISTVASGQNQLTQNGITWTFSTAPTYGQYASGDYWVVGPITVTNVSHISESGVIDGVVINVINPRWQAAQGYDSRIPNYNAGLSATVPFSANAGDSIVSVTQLISIGGAEGTYIADAAVLSVVDAPQNADKFRPPYVRPNRQPTSSVDSLIYSTNQIQWSLLPNLSLPASTPSMAHTLGLVQKVWLDHLPNYPTNSRIHPLNNMHDYGRDIASDVSEAALQLMLNQPAADKQALCIKVIQLGIDAYGCMLDGAEWHADGGHGSGRKFPLVLAGIMLGRSEIQSVSLKMSNGTCRFGEDGQTYYYDDADLPLYLDRETNTNSNGPVSSTVFRVRGVKGWVGRANGEAGDLALFRMYDSPSSSTSSDYEHLDVENWSTTTSGDHQHRFEAYRWCCTSTAWSGYGLAIMLMGSSAMRIWNHDAFFDYLIRWMTESDLNAILRYVKVFPGESSASRQGTSGNAFTDSMWNSYGKSIKPIRTDALAPSSTTPKGLGIVK